MGDPTELPERIASLLEHHREVDDALRAVVEELAAAPGSVWAGIAFLEEGELVLGPASGHADEPRRARTPIAFGGDPVGELWVDGVADRAPLEEVAELISPYVLLGWDTGGKAWEP